MSGSLWVDDCKPCPDGYAVARTYDDALRLLRRFDYDELFLDHDLGDHHVPERTGYGLLNQVYADGRLPDRVVCISWNPVGRRRIEEQLVAFGYLPSDRGFIRTTVTSTPLGDLRPSGGGKADG